MQSQLETGPGFSLAESKKKKAFFDLLAGVITTTWIVYVFPSYFIDY